jgi:hypothetical protein
MSDLNSSFVTKKNLALAACAAVLAACSSSPSATSPNNNNNTVTFKNSPCGAGGTVTMAVNTATRVDCSNGGTTVTLAGNGASYVVIPELPTDQVADNFVVYHLASGTLASSAASAGMLRAARRLGSGVSTRLVTPMQGPSRIRPGALQQAFDRMLRKQGRQLAASGALRSSASRAMRKSVASGSVTVPAAGSVRNFQVVSNLNGTAFKTVTATLSYVGASLLLYIDTAAPANGLTGVQLQSFGQYFDQILYPMDTAAFGSPTDLDHNGHVIMLMSPVVNADTPASLCQSEGSYVAGFFDSEDFNSASDPNSNQGEIFYSIVPDPTGTVSCSHTVADILFDVPATFLHELQHLINYSQHVIVHNGNAEVGAEDEGLSIVAEELGSRYYETKCPPPLCRANPSQIYPDSSAGFLSSVAYDSYQYAYLPDTASVTLHDDSEDGISWRGGDWALMHWLGDQFGAGVYKKLDAGLTTGVANIESATGQTFPSLFANFGLALYTDTMPGLPRATAPAADRFSTRNLRTLWEWTFQEFGPQQGVGYIYPIALYPITTDTTSSILSPGTLSFYRLDTPSTAATVTIEFAQPGGVALQTVLHPQLAIYRLAPGQ